MIIEGVQTRKISTFYSRPQKMMLADIPNYKLLQICGRHTAFKINFCLLLCKREDK